MLAIPHPGESYSAAQLRGLLASRDGHVTLADIANELEICGFGQWAIQRIGTHVLALTDYRDRTLTIDGGLDVSVLSGRALVIVCQGGHQILVTHVDNARNAVEILEDALDMMGL